MDAQLQTILEMLRSQAAKQDEQAAKQDDIVARLDEQETRTPRKRVWRSNGGWRSLNALIEGGM